MALLILTMPGAFVALSALFVGYVAAVAMTLTPVVRGDVRQA